MDKTLDQIRQIALQISLLDTPPVTDIGHALEIIFNAQRAAK